MKYKNLKNMRTPMLLKLHNAIAEALRVDDGIAVAEHKPYGVRVFSDFQEQTRAIEGELDKRNVNYTKIVW